MARKTFPGSKCSARKQLLCLLSVLSLVVNNSSALASIQSNDKAQQNDAKSLAPEKAVEGKLSSAQLSTEVSDTSASQNGNPLTVDTIKVEGNRLVPTEDIMHVVKTKPGDKFNRDAVMEDLKAINNLGYFDERNLQVVPELNGSGVLLKIRVQENAPITQFAFLETMF